MVWLSFTLMIGCQKEDDIETEEEEDIEIVLEIENIDNHDNLENYYWDESDITPIVLNNNSITVSGEGATASGSILTITSAGTYSISGTLSDGQIIVDSDDDEIVRLILNGVDIYCSNNAPIYVQSAEKTMIVLANETNNSISDGTSYISSEEDANAAIYSADDLIIYGNGSLVVDANYNDGITSKDGLIIASGSITVNAKDDGIRGKDYLAIYSGDISINAEGDGLKSDNDEDAAKGYISVSGENINITSANDAIQAYTNVTIYDGEITLKSGGGSTNTAANNESAKGIKADGSIIINNGKINIDAADDAIHSNIDIDIYDGIINIASAEDAIHAENDLLIDNGIIEITNSYEGLESTKGGITINDGEIYITSNDDGINVAAGDDSDENKNTSSTYILTINDGYIVINASGDGIDSNGDVTINNGTIIVSGASAGSNSALDCDGTFLSNGGFLVATGTTKLAIAPDNGSSQYSVMITLNSTISAETMIHIQNENGDNVLSLLPAKAYQSVVFSSPLLLNGETYDVYYGGSSTGTVNNGLYDSESYTPGTFFAEFTISSSLTTVN